MTGRPELMRLPLLPPAVLETNLVERGDLPRRIARSMMDSPELVLQATVFYFDCIEADNGDGEAKARVDLMREKVAQMRAMENALGNNPDLGYVGPAQGRARVGIPSPISRRDPAPIPSKRELRRISERSSAPKIIMPND